MTCLHVPVLPDPRPIWLLRSSRALEMTISNTEVNRSWEWPSIEQLYKHCLLVEMIMMPEGLSRCAVQQVNS